MALEEFKTEKVKACDLKVGDEIKRFSYEHGMTWIDKITKIEPYKLPNRQVCLKLYWEKGYDGYPTLLINKMRCLNKVIE